MAAARPSYLIKGTEYLVVEDDKLPSNGEILKYMIFHYDNRKQNETARNIATKLLPTLFEYYDKVIEYFIL